MRGLTVFIADLRNCRARELEEKRINKEMANIRAKFKDSGLSGYHKKKYVAKLLYMYILGWDIDFGHHEAVNLLSSTKYSEKQIGYLASTLIISETNDLQHSVVRAIGMDLASSNEISVCLALQAIANIGSKEMAVTLSSDVEQLLVNGHHNNFVKKKAALCLLRLFRKHPEVFGAVDWAPRILNMMDDRDLGVALSVTTLVLALAQQYTEAYEGCVDKAISRLYKIVVEKEFSADYIYYKVPVPWLQVKLLRLLQYYPPTSDFNMMTKLGTVLQSIIRNSEETPKNVQHNNAQNAVLFEAINLTIHLDPESDLMDQELILLGNYLASKETNVRYLGLETMCHLAGAGSRNCMDALRVHKDTVLASLRDKDISVRRRALDLLYSMCDQTNAREIVAELLQYLIIADYAIREEMVLKIAILTEKFAMEYSWYVDVILQLVTVAGDHVFDDIWYRVIQIIVNNDELQQYAAKTLLEALKQPSCHETTVKVAGYALGEFGHLIANMPGCYPIDQFAALHSKFGICSTPTKCILFTTYLKFINLFPEVKSEIMAVFETHRTVLNIELQQRASEYYAIASMETDDLLQTICEEMPAFNDRESALLARLRKKIADTEDKRTWVIGGRDANLEIAKMRAANRQVSESNNVVYDDVLPSEIEQTRDPPVQPYVERNPSPVSGSPEEEEEEIRLDTTKYLPTRATTAAAAETVVDDTTLYNRLLLNSNGLLHRDPILEIGLKSEYRNSQGRLALFFGNRSMVPIENLSTNIVTNAGIQLTLLQGLPETIPAGQQFNQVYSIECVAPFLEPPSIEVSYSVSSNAGVPTTLSLRLPILITKFVSPVTLDASDFYEKWKQIGGPPREYQSTFKALAGSIITDSSESRKILEGLRFGIIEGVDPSPLNLVAVGIFNSAELGKSGCMLRLEINLQHQMYRLTVRSSVPLIAELLKNIVQEVIRSIF
ncbi:hypothetical protein HDV05_000540 [Chytridiales sp. JEL 0842]|nr:hypothetical protein HDV05_000540 [Chytridiales sp. JEL 0842]